MTPPVLLSERRGAVLLLTLNRPERRNALGPDLVAALTEELSALRAGGEVRAVLLTGAGDAFCAGADLSALQSLRNAGVGENASDSQRLKALYLALLKCPLPTVAAVRGPALAGGCGLATACDAVVAEEGATFGYPEVKIGFVAAMVSVLLARQLGERAARTMLLSGKAFTAVEAQALGLVSRVVPEGSFLEEALGEAQRLATGAPGALAFTKELLAATGALPLEVALEVTAHANVFARQSGEVTEGVDAFLAKRRPPWNPK